MTSPAFVAHAALALEAQYATFGVAATWTPRAGGDPTPCTVIKRSPDAEVRLGGDRAVAATNTIHVRVSEIPAVALRDVFAIVGGASYRVLVDPPADDFGLEWVCEVAPV